MASKIKSFLSDRTFVILIWPHIFGFVSQGIVTAILLVLLLVINPSFASFLDALSSEVQRIARWSIFLVLVLNVGFLFINGAIMKYYQFAPSIGSDGSTLSLKEVKNQFNNDEDRRLQRFFQYFGPGIVLFLVCLEFVGIYFFEGEGRTSIEMALEAALLSIIPFSLALTIAHFSRIIVEICILFIRYSKQENNITA